MTSAAAPVRSERAGTIGLVIIDNPPVNALSHAVRSGLKEALDAAIADPAIRAIVILCAGRTFIAGADITEFDKPRRDPITTVIAATLDDSPKPVIAAMHGTALGGGLEVALGCHWRIATPDAKLGQPEVKLGLLPGAGGTQRLPRLVGFSRGLAMIAGGEPIDAATARDAGLVDEIVTGDLRPTALAFAELVLAEKRPLRRARDIAAKLAPSEDGIFARARADYAKRKRGVDAPQRCIDAVEAAATLPFDQGMAREREIFSELVFSAQSKAQRHFFFAEREVAKIPDLPPDTPRKEIRKAAVIGSGTMGGGIAMCFANAGIPVVVVEVGKDALERGIGVVRKNYAISASRGAVTAEQVEERLSLIAGTTDYDTVADADVVIEAVFEELPLKQDVFRRIDAIAHPDAILASNTSYLDVDAIAATTRRPERVLGTHFFSPANVMRLLEVVRGAKTAPATIATTMALARKLRKVPVLVGVCHGFVGNRMLAQRTREMERLLAEGALPQEIDRAIYEFGFPMGPCAMGDLAGLDVSWRMRQSRGLKAPVADALVAAGRLGQKTGAGFYRYDTGSRTPIPDPEVERIILDVSRSLGKNRRAIPQAEILERLLYPMINEGAKILAEAIALRPGDIDVIWVYGYGWPIQTGGPMFHADALGLAAIRDRLAALAQEHDEPALMPAPLLVKLADEGRGFAEWKAAR